ncbi:hypothetical protein [Chryseobacterium luteum]|uniref:GRAM domain-containing protein n=1 Tax=Chryseobacterium luteum TaxID=421531 RepID=A0A085ZTN7_9FLAO|nr:hypothetical protein [Chryseobacterium luteum]KFF07801.1 hypothetical protein IX38_08875 [Chryseobacterium luteum]
MPDNIFDYLFLIFITFLGVSPIFFFVQNRKIIAKYKQPDSRELKNISGKIILENGFLRKKIHWCSFDVLMNQNSVFLFPADFYFIPRRFINLTFNSDKKNTKSPTGLREFSFNRDNIVLVSYPDFLVNQKRTIYLQNLTPEQIMLFQEALKNRMPSVLH